MLLPINLSFTTEQFDDDFIDREIETNLCIDTILSHQNGIVFGERGVGKTALVKHVIDIIRNKHSGIIPIYISFSPGRIDSRHSYTFHLLISLIQFIWKDILGNQLTSLYDYDSSFPNELSKQAHKIHKLIQSALMNEKISLSRSVGADWVIKGNADKTRELSNSLDPLSNQEMIGLLVELCDELVAFSDASQIAFICDEANQLDARTQLEIENDITNILPLFSSSFIYVASVSQSIGGLSPYFDCFDRLIQLEGFKKTEYSKKLIQNRIIDKGRVKLEEAAYSRIHEQVNGNPRWIISLLSEITMQMREFWDDTPSLSISVKDVDKAWAVLEAKREKNERLYRELHEKMSQEKNP